MSVCIEQAVKTVEIIVDMQLIVSREAIKGQGYTDSAKQSSMEELLSSINQK